MKLILSFFYALRGIGICIKTERNFRIHMIAIVTTLLFSYLYGLSKEQYPALILILALVPSLEAVNTAIERAVDLESSDPHPLARAAKDAAAGAVLLSAMGAIAMACVLFSDIERLGQMVSLFTAPPMLIGLAIYILAGACFVFLPGRKNKGVSL